MSDVIAAPSVRALALQKGIDLEKLAKDLGRTSIAREDLEGGNPAGRPAGDTSYWDVDHSQFGPVIEDPMSRFAQVAAANLGIYMTDIIYHFYGDATESMYTSFQAAQELANVPVKRIG